jgi:hypothetical protein
MKTGSCGALVAGAVIAGVSLLVFPAVAQSTLSKEMGKKWGDKCAPTGRATTCCNTQRNEETACKGLEKERMGSTVVRNCDDAEKICQVTVRSAEEAKKAEEEKKKKAEDAKKAEEKKAAPQGSGSSTNGQPQLTTLPSARQFADGWKKQLEQLEDEYPNALDAAKNGKTKPEIERALKRAEEIKKRIDELRRRIGDLSPAERIPYTSKLPTPYVSKSPFDLVYDKISVTLCGKNGKAQWDGNIVSCQKGPDAPSGGDRPIPPATDIAPNDPNKR